ncbi:MAG: bifunctional phosphopantothenoylcysteine decarboxylase/phosphopantothenate--cysteine ligase CoaBC [Bacteroidetes bacterium]|nr:MAG: bifunctional phosphopantothenoylcysteine decarboxylase/phosphopantothenate--cysteine ligase CoaBC [Bacteroidota bacterium]
MLTDKKIILGVSGSIAAYKTVYLLRLLKKAGAAVRVVTTPAVSHFVGELSWSSLSGHKVFGDLWSENWSEHVALGTWADLMVVAPATANTLAKFAHGLCDNALTAVYLSARCPVVVAPAMDADMYQHARLQANLDTLRADGVQVLPVGQGFLASGLHGPGRMAEPEEIFEAIAARWKNGPLAGKKVMITAGPTREAIDPVRYISNHSSGKMGFALARAAAALGAQVSLISGPTQLAPPPQVAFTSVNSAREMFEAVKQIAHEQDILIMAAAVSDYTPVEVAPQKIKKQTEELHIPLKKTTDILHYLGTVKQAHQLLVGFALETEDELQHAKDKLRRKNLDLIVLNSLRDKGAGFSHDTNKITLIDRQEQVQHFPLKPKEEVAKDILNKIVDMLKEGIYMAD